MSGHAPSFVTLPKARSDTSRCNTSAEWITNLGAPISLQGWWDVASAELQYMNSIHNISADQVTLLETVSPIREQEGDGKRKSLQPTETAVAIQRGSD